MEAGDDGERKGRKEEEENESINSTDDLSCYSSYIYDANYTETITLNFLFFRHF